LSAPLGKRSQPNLQHADRSNTPVTCRGSRSGHPASSPGELEITCNTSEVAVSCSRASASSHLSCSSRSEGGARIRPVRVFASVPVERRFSALRDKVTSSPSLVPSRRAQPRIEAGNPNRSARRTRVFLDHLRASSIDDTGAGPL